MKASIEDAITGLNETLEKAARKAGTDLAGFKKLPKREQNEFLAETRADARLHPESGVLWMVSPAQIVRSPFNRSHFIEEALEELVADVRQRGVLQPLIVRLNPMPGKGQPGFELIAGERRWRAAIAAKLELVPVIVRTANDQEALEMQAVENLHREDLNAIDEAEKYQQLVDCYTAAGLTKTQAIEKLRTKLGNKSEAGIYAKLTLLKLPEPVQELVLNGKLPKSHAELLTKISDPKLAEAAAKKVTSGRNGEPLSWQETKRVADEAVERQKRLAEWQSLRERFSKNKNLVLSDADNKKLFPEEHDWLDTRSGFVRGDQMCDNDPKYRNWKVAMGKHAPDPVLARAPSGTAVIVYPTLDAREAVKKNRPRETTKPAQNPALVELRRKMAETKAQGKREQAELTELLKRIEGGGVATRQLWEWMAVTMAEHCLHHDTARALTKRRGLDEKAHRERYGSGYRNAVEAHSKTLKTEKEMQAFCVELAIGGGSYFRRSAMKRMSEIAGGKSSAATQN